MEDNVILVDERDTVLGEMPKLEAHQKGVLHRAFSVFIFNDKKELMLQKRADSKYHSPSLWSNTCCSHPRLGETTIQAGERRLLEEMGFSVPLNELFSFIYKADFSNGLIEHELDYILVGHYNEMPVIVPEEVGGWKWVKLSELSADVKENSDNYTIWFQHLLNEHIERIKDNS